MPNLPVSAVDSNAEISMPFPGTEQNISGGLQQSISVVTNNGYNQCADSGTLRRDLRRSPQEIKKKKIH